MWQGILAVLLIPGLAAAQAPQEVVPQVSQQTVNLILHGPPRVPSTPPPLYQTYTRYDAIRRGREEDIGVQLRIGAFVATTNDASGVIPLKLEFEPLGGISVKEIHVPNGEQVKKGNARFAIAVSPYVHFKIRADRNAPLGLRVLKGSITFQKLHADGSAAGPVEHVDVQIPLTIVDYDAKVRKADFPYAPMQAWEVVVIILAVPVLIAVAIPLILLCGVTGTCPSC